MDIRILKYFLAVAREENITRAAESLHIAQPSLSKQMMELEQERHTDRRRNTASQTCGRYCLSCRKNRTGNFLWFYGYLR